MYSNTSFQTIVFDFLLRIHTYLSMQCWWQRSGLTSQTYLSRRWCESLLWPQSLWGFKDSWGFHLSAWLPPSEPGQTSMIPYCTDSVESSSLGHKSPRWDRPLPLFPLLAFFNAHSRKSLSWTEVWHRFTKKERCCYRRPWHASKPRGACLSLKEDSATGGPVLTMP